MLTNKEVSDYITKSLGDSKVKIELDKDDLETVIQHAIDRLRPYYNGIRYVQVDGASSPIDLSSHNIIEITDLYETGSNGITQLQSQMFLQPGVFVFNSDFKDNYISYLTYARLANTYQYVNNTTWKWVKPYVYISKSMSVVLKCIVSLRVLSDISRDSHYYAWVKDYALALSRIMVGEMRGKYKLTNGQYELNGDDMISRGVAERDKLEGELQGAFPVY